MTGEAERADRRRDVRAAARAWRRCGLIDESTQARILEAHPDDRSRVGTAFRVLLFLFGVVAVFSLFGVFAVMEVPTGFLLVSTAVGSFAATEVQVQKFRRANAGSEEATAILAVLFAVATLAWLMSESGGDFEWRAVVAFLSLFSWLAAWRWGIPALGALSAGSAFLMLAWWSGARMAWTVLGAALVLPLLKASVSAELAPSQRRACDAALVTTLLAIYLAVHLGSFDLHLLESESLFGLDTGGASDSPSRWLFVLATAVVPALVLLAGIHWKRPILLRSGLVLSVASLVTLRFYVHVAPLWVVLTFAGAAAIALAMLVHRYLASGKGKERYGFTADPLFERAGAADALEAGMTASLAPAAAAGHEDPRFKGGGGEFGGGGATGSY